MSIILEVQHLKTFFQTRKGVVKAVDDVCFSIDEGQIFGLVGESGAGKSITGFSIINMIDPPGRIESGSITLAGHNILKMKEVELRRLRGKEVSMIFQDPLTSLNPVLTVRRQMLETLSYHNLHKSKNSLLKRSIEVLEEVGLPNPAQQLESYPHQLSGGMKQRVVIAMALVNNPRLLIADEPTTALDVTIQAQILLLMKNLCKDHGSALILITHDIGVVAQMCDVVAVMYAGRIVEQGKKDEVLSNPLHPYTKGLIKCLPKLNLSRDRLTQIPGIMPSLLNLPKGCHFRERCSDATEECKLYPEERVIEGRRVSCHHVK
jgi:oligopeptide/dipeptide ABC transporter ATP-binding protein